MLNGGHDSVDMPALRHDVVQDKMKLYSPIVYYGSSDYNILGILVESLNEKQSVPHCTSTAMYLYFSIRFPPTSHRKSSHKTRSTQNIPTKLSFLYAAISFNTSCASRTTRNHRMLVCCALLDLERRTARYPQLTKQRLISLDTSVCILGFEDRKDGVRR